MKPQPGARPACCGHAIALDRQRGENRFGREMSVNHYVNRTVVLFLSGFMTTPAHF